MPTLKEPKQVSIHSQSFLFLQVGKKTGKPTMDGMDAVSHFMPLLATTRFGVTSETSDIKEESEIKATTAAKGLQCCHCRD